MVRSWASADGSIELPDARDIVATSHDDAEWASGCPDVTFVTASAGCRFCRGYDTSHVNSRHDGQMAERFAARPALRPLAHRDFRLLLGGSAVVGVLFPLHLMTQVFWVSQHFPASAVIYSSILAASRGSGMVTFSLVGGAIADRADRKRVLLVCESLSLVAHAAIAVLMRSEEHT